MQNSKELNNTDTIKYKNNKNKNNLYMEAGEKIKEKFDSEITLINNKIKDIMKVIKSSKDREISLK